jgi:hypothetical protein
MGSGTRRGEAGRLSGWLAEAWVHVTLVAANLIIEQTDAGDGGRMVCVRACVCECVRSEGKKRHSRFGGQGWLDHVVLLMGGNG